MPTQEEQLQLISSASLTQTQAVLDLKATLTQLVTDATNQFNATIARVNALNNVDNIADINKGLSTLTQIEIDKKQPTLISGANISTVNGVSLLTGEPLVIERSATSLHSLSYVNAGSLRSPIIPLPVANDSVIIEGLGLFMYVQEVSEPDDSETCFTALDPITALPIGQWLLRVPAFEWLSANSAIAKSILLEFIDDKNN